MVDFSLTFSSLDIHFKRAVNCLFLNKNCITLLLSENMHRAARMKKEIAMFNDKPPFGISCWNKDDSLERLEARKYVIVNLPVD